MSRSNPRKTEAEKAERAARKWAEALEFNNRRVIAERRVSGPTFALKQGGEQAYKYWQANRTQMVRDGTLAADVVVTPLAWVPQWPTPPLPQPLPPTPSVLEAAQVAADLLMGRPRMTRED